MNKNRINLSLVLVTVAVAGMTFVFSCAKDSSGMDGLSSEQNSSGSTMRYTECADVSNPANPYDDIGAAHNAGLVYILDHKAEWEPLCDEPSLRNKLIELTANFTCENGYGPPADCFGTLLTQLTGNMNTYTASTHEDIIADMGSAALQGYMHELLDEVGNYEDSTQIDSLLAHIRQIESSAAASTMSADEKETFLKCASIGRYSACYAFQEFQKSQTDWTPCPNPQIPAGKINWKRVAAVVGGDIIGGAMGGVGGAIVVSGYCLAIT